MGRRMSAGGGEAAAILCLLLLSAVGRTVALSLTVRGSDVECVYEYVYYKDDTVSGNFVLLNHDPAWNTGHPGIDFAATSPEGNTVHSLKGSLGEKFQFKVPTSGMHKFCFHNPHSTPEAVSFNIHIGHIPKEHDLAKDEHFDPVNAKIAELSESLESVILEQRYLKARSRSHLHTNASTSRRVIFYTVGEYMLLILLSGLQVVYIRRLFSKTVAYGRV